MVVEKTHASILQEITIKMGFTPVYELLLNQMNSLTPIFTYKLTCNNFTTFGSGKSKKHAKQNAAQMMIQKISENTVVSEPTYPADNSVQELMNLCNKLCLEEPAYKDLEISGPAHARVYTTQCIVSKFQEVASARAKKQSKQNAAKKMINQLKDTFNIVTSSDKNGMQRVRQEDITDTVYDANKSDFSQVTKMHEASKLKINYQLKMESECKELLKTLGDGSFNLLNNLAMISKLIAECQLNCDNKKISHLKGMFQNAMDEAKIDFHHMLLQTAEPSTSMLIIQLNIVPDVIEMSIGKTREESEWRTIKKVVNTLQELLNQ